MPQLFRKAIEGLSFSLLVSLFIISLLLPAVFYELGFFSSFIRDARIKQAVNDVETSISALKASGRGSFLKLKFSVPENSNAFFNSANNSLAFGNNSYSLNAELLNDLKLNQGDYEITLFYGKPSELKEFTVGFE